MLHVKSLVPNMASMLALALSILLQIGGGASTSSTRIPGDQTAATKQPTRRALLIGINNYDPTNPVPAPDQCATAAPKSGHRSKRGIGAKAEFVTLEGPRNDVCSIRELLIQAFKFEPGNIRVLREKEATREGIITAFNDLIIKSDRGDTVFFFYSGHGAQVRNTLGGEPDQLDETMVPIDWKRPIEKREDARDIRDKEIFKLFKEAAKKVTLTALFDSCHSGGISRGGLGEERAKTGPDEVKFDFKEPPADKDQQGTSDEDYLVKAGVLVISAARDDQEAKERSYDEVWRGNFTYSLKQVLQSPAVRDLSAARVFERLVVGMKSNGASHEPVIWGSATRRNQTLLGEKVDPAKRPEVIVESVDRDGKITLQGGRAVGLNKNCEFVKKGDEAKSNAVRIRITEDPDYVKSVAEVIAKDAAAAQEIAETIKPNDTFVLEKWASGGEPNLVVWIPPAQLTEAQLNVAAQEITKLSQGGRVQLVADPTANVATYFLSHDGTNWLLKLPDDEVTTIGTTLTAKAVLDKLPPGGKVDLFYSLPPSKDFGAQIKLGDGTDNSAVGVSKIPRNAHYWLVGRAREDAGRTVIEYAWLRPEATADVAKPGDPNAGEVMASNAGVSPLPALTDWKATTTELEMLALRLGKIRGWVKLQSPQGNSGGFAYQLVLRNCRGDVNNCKGEILSAHNAMMVDGEIFSISLVADESLLHGTIAQRHVYVFSLDRNGKSELMYPDLSRTADTKLPFVSPSSEVRKEIELAKIRICGPDIKKSGCRSPGVLGPETYVMLTTVEKLSDPTVLESEGVRTQEEIRREMNAKGIRGEESQLMSLLTAIGSSSRNELVVPVNWSVQQVFFSSVEKKP